MIENLFQTLFYEIGRYLEKMRFDFAIRSVVTRNGSLFFISGTNQVIHFHVNEDRQVNIEWSVHLIGGERHRISINFRN